MNRVSIKRRYALAAGAAGIAGLVIVGGAAAANASPHPTPGKPGLVGVDGAPDPSKVQPIELSPAPAHQPVIAEGDGVSVTEVPGAVPDLSKVRVIDATEVDAPPVVIGGHGTTTVR